MGETWGIYRPGCQRLEVLLEVLLKVLCSSQKLAVIISMTSIKIAFLIDLKTNKIFVTLFFALRRESLITQINCRSNAFDAEILKNR